MSQQTPNSTLLRICSEEVVAYLKVLEVCASFVLTEREELITKENELRLRNPNHPGLEIFSKLFGTDNNNNHKNPKKQLTFNKTIEIIKRQSSSTNNNNNNNSTSNDVAFRVYSQEERHRMSNLATQATSDDHNNNNNNNDTVLSLSNKIILETLYDHLLNAARRKILKCLPQLKLSSNDNNNNNNNNNGDASQLSPSAVVDVSLWPPCDDIEETLVLNKQLGDRAAVTVSDFLANAGGNSSALVTSTTPDTHSNNNNNNGQQPSCEILLYGILRKVVVENILLASTNNSNSLKNNNSNKNVISLSEALFIHRLECDAPGVYECTVARDTVHTIARRRARELNTVTTSSSTTMMMLTQNNNNNSNNSDENAQLQENLKSLNQGDRSAAGFAYRNYLKTKANEIDDNDDNNNNKNNEKNKKQQQQQNQNQQDVEIPVTNTTIEYQVLPARTVDVISVNSRADGGILVQPWSLEKENYSSNQTLNVALRRTLFSFLLPSSKQQQQNQRNETAVITSLQKNFQNVVAASSILPPLASIEHLMKICVGASVSNAVSTLLGNQDHLREVVDSSTSSKKVYVRYGVNVSVVNTPEVYIFVPKSALTLKSKLAAFGGASQQQDDHTRKILNHSTLEESKFSKFLFKNSRGNSNILFDNLQQHLRFSNKFGLDVNQAASNLKVRFFYPGFFLRDEFQHQEQKQHENNNSNNNDHSDDAAAASSTDKVATDSSTTTTKPRKKNNKNQDIDEIDASLIKEKYDFKSTLSRENISLPPIEHMTVFDDTTTYYNNLIFRNNSANTNNNNEILAKKKELLGKLRELLFCEEKINNDNADNNTFEILDFVENNQCGGAFLKDPTTTATQKQKKSKNQVGDDRDDSLLESDDDEDADETTDKKEHFSVVRVIKVKNSPENFNFASLVFSMFVLHGHRTAGGFASSSSSSATSDDDNNMLRNINNEAEKDDNNGFFSANNNKQNTMTSMGGDQAYQQELKLKDDQLFLQNFLQKHHSIKEDQKKQQQQVDHHQSNNSAVTRLNNSVGNSGGGAAIFKREDTDVERILIRAMSAKQNMKLSELMSTVNAGVGPNNANLVPQMQMNRVLKKIAQFDASAGGYKLK